MLAGLQAIAWLAGPVFLALVVVITLDPVRTWLRDKGLPRRLTVAVLVVTVYTALLAVFLVVVVSLAQLSALLPRYAGRADQMLRDGLTALVGLAGIPGAALWGLLAFVTNYVPNVGFVIGVAPPALIALLDGGWRAMLVVLVVYGALNFVVQSLIQPRFVAGSVGLGRSTTCSRSVSSPGGESGTSRPRTAPGGRHDPGGGVRAETQRDDHGDRGDEQRDRDEEGSRAAY